MQEKEAGVEAAMDVKAEEEAEQNKKDSRIFDPVTSPRSSLPP